MKTSALLCLCGLVLAPAFVRAESALLEVRQTVIRAPEMEVIALMAGPRKTDAEIVAALREAVKQGRASVVSEVASAADDGGAVSVKNGRHFWLPSELDQEFDRLYLPPTAFNEHLTGTSLTCTPARNGTDAEQQVWAEWTTQFVPREPFPVQWPTSWLNVYDEQYRPTHKAIHGWLDWRDVFEESVTGTVDFPGESPTLMAIMPPADQVWPGDRPGRWLDVFFAQADLDDQEKRPPAKTHSNRVLLLGIGIGKKEALRLMEKRDPKDDAGLLHKLLNQVRDGKAHMRLANGLMFGGSGHCTLTSARLHDYPTEMPSIPSAWDAFPVGAHWELDEGLVMSLRQDLAPPARTEWKLAEDVPEAIMWQPRFRGLKIDAAFQNHSTDTELLGLLHVPPVMRGDGMPEDETLLVFAKRDAEPGLAKGMAPVPVPQDPFGPQPSQRPVAALLPGYEAEMIVAEVPAAEEAGWQPADKNDWHEPDARRFQPLLDRLQSGRTPLIAHVVIKLCDRRRSQISITEDYHTATEFDPPEPHNPLRMRPTALETLRVGSHWEVDFAAAEDGKEAVLDFEFIQTTARPIEPGLKETVAIAAAGKERYTGAIHHQESWRDSLAVTFGSVRCLGVRKPPGIEADVRHVAFLRVRQIKP